MKQSSYTVGTQQKIIEAIANGLEWNVNINVDKSVVEKKLVNGILPTGTLIAKDGSVAAVVEGKSNAYGVLVNDVDFNNSNGTEILAVCIHGCLSKAMIKKYSGYDVADVDQTALNMIKFLD
ncbi:hypothetical protein [Clostridium sp. HBUAS56017]|uniref:hypothetical protein n=1 Tax=Clostridium sp. HBUAS56017 TaxID=2571128 RepID=UPI0011774E77|nr:hypothetical protein [Clostridium sp. HBUAS56017]